jgi:tripartite-type tricarboxylate transporter receptor subunit TctC
MKNKYGKLLTACALALTASTASAQGGDITKLVVAFPPGGPQDVVARILAEQLTTELHQTVIVDNRPGANGAIAASLVKHSAADGKTIWVTSAGAATINPWLYPKLGYDMQNDFAPVSLVTNNAELLVTYSANPAKTLKDYLAQGTRPEAPLAIASTGLGSVPHMAIEQLRASGNVNVLHVPYKGAAPAVSDLMGGQVSGLFADTIGVISQVKGGKLRALGIAAPKRTAALPDVPTLQEQGLPDIDTNNWFALFVNAKTPKAKIDEINAAVRRALEDPKVSERLSSNGSEPAPSTPEALGELVKNDTAKWGRLIKAANIHLDD